MYLSKNLRRYVRIYVIQEYRNNNSYERHLFYVESMPFSFLYSIFKDEHIFL